MGDAAVRITVILLASLLGYETSQAQPAGRRKDIPEAATKQDSMDVYNNAKAVEDFYERSGLYKKTGEHRLHTDDPYRIHAGNDKKFEEVLATIDRERLTNQGKRKIRPGEYRININKYKYKQRELSDFVLNTDAPMQLFDRRIAPQILVDYAYTGNVSSALNADDVDFKMYDPIAIKPYSMLTPEEKRLREAKYPRIGKPAAKPAPLAKAPPKALQKHPSNSGGGLYYVSGGVPDSVRLKPFKTRSEADEYIKRLPAVKEDEY